ncbi:MAG: tRNA (adenosine(37)-N6)-dimethylallyltransferase MiaA [Candidatus Beckwithbacteria bacterium]
MNQILIICGPTATGKTKLAIKLARKFNGQIISADSRQVYQGMDIVTGKDLPVLRQANIKILGLDLVKPDQEFSVAHFVNFAQPLIAKIHARNQLPIFVGGTGLYLNALIKPIGTIDIKPNLSLRKKLELKTVLQLQQQLLQANPAKFSRMNHSDQLNPRRLIRALEISLRGVSLKAVAPNLQPLWLGLTTDLKILDQKIAARVKQRHKAGAIKEWQNLKKRYSIALPSMSAIGYRQLPDIAAWLKAEQQYCRRQLTWFKSNSAIHWFDITTGYYQPVVNLIQSWYTNKYD